MMDKLTPQEHAAYMYLSAKMQNTAQTIQPNTVPLPTKKKRAKKPKPKQKPLSFEAKMWIFVFIGTLTSLIIIWHWWHTPAH